MRKNKIIIVKSEESLGGFDLDDMRKKLSEFFKPYGIEVLLLNANYSLIDKEELRKMLK